MGFLALAGVAASTLPLSTLVDLDTASNCLLARQVLGSFWTGAGLLFIFGVLLGVTGTCIHAACGCPMPWPAGRRAVDEGHGLAAPDLAHAMLRERLQERDGEGAASWGWQGWAFWFAMTPDGDVYPHALTIPGFSGVAAFDDDNHIIQESAAGTVLRKIEQVHGHDWQPSPMKFFAALELAGVSLQHSPDAGNRSSGARPGTRRRLAGKQPIASGATQSGNVDVGYEHLPDAAPNVWIVKGSSGNTSAHTVIGNAAVDENAASRASLCRHTKWRHECGLGASDIGVGDHELLGHKVLEISVGYDQLNITELACVELLMRKAQLAEWRHRERLTSRAGSDDMLEDEFLYLGTGETRGLIVVAPALQDHIRQELHQEYATAKERRK
ncbi:unnamed protein product, partial [Prorocentrum cordatum]